MPKMKTNKAVKKRFKLTATGKLKRPRCGKRHILTKKTSKRKRFLSKQTLVNQGQVKMFKMMMGV